MIQENGPNGSKCDSNLSPAEMPVEFEAFHRSGKRPISVGSLEWFTDGTILVNGDIPLSEVILRQRIGAISSDDPKQKLYLGDVVEVAPIKDFTKHPMIGELIWHKFGVYLRCWNTFEKDFEYWSFHSFVKAKTPIKKLGSRYDPKMEEV